MKSEYESTFRNLQFEHKANVSEMRVKHEHAVALMKRKHEAYIRALESQHVLNVSEMSDFKDTKVSNLQNRLSKLVTKRVQPQVMKWYSRIKERRAELRYLVQELLDTEIHLVDQMDFVDRCYVKELRRRVKYHAKSHLRSIRDGRMSKSSPTLRGSMDYNNKMIMKVKKKKSKRTRGDSEFYKPGTEVRVIRKGKFMFQTGTFFCCVCVSLSIYLYTHTQ